MSRTPRCMDESESQVRDYLEQLGYKQNIYQPDRNVPPDLLADGRIAVEVRRPGEVFHLNRKSSGDSAR